MVHPPGVRKKNLLAFLERSSDHGGRAGPGHVKTGQPSRMVSLICWLVNVGKHRLSGMGVI